MKKYSLGNIHNIRHLFTVLLIHVNRFGLEQLKTEAIRLSLQEEGHDHA